MHSGRSPGTGDLGGAQERHGAEADLADGRGREDARDVPGGGEDRADDVVLDQVVALHDPAHELLGPVRDLLDRVRLDGGRPAETSTTGASGMAGHVNGCRPGGLRVRPPSGLPRQPYSGPLRGRPRCSRQGLHLGCGEVSPPSRGQAGVPQRPDPGPDQAADRMADGVAHPADLAVLPFVDDEPQHAGPQHTHPAGAVRPSSSSTPCRNWRRPPASGSPSTSATYSLSTPWDGWASSWARAPSLVRISNPSVAWSRRPTGKTRGSAGTRSSTVGPALGVAGRGDDAFGLVQQVVDEAGCTGSGSPSTSTRAVVTRCVPDGDRAVDRGRGPARSGPRRPGGSPAGAGQHLLQAFAIPLGDLRRRRIGSPSTSTPSALCRPARTPPPRRGPGRKSSTGGSWSSESSPRRSKNRSVVPNSTGWPGPSARPTTSM